MKIIEDYIYNIDICENLSVALGTFDGVHRGHQELIKRAVTEAKEMNIKSAVITFDVHPLKVLKPDAHVKIITNNTMKAEILEELGVDYLIFVKFTKELAHIDEKAFVETLSSRFHAKSVTCGFNYTYGRLGHGNTSTLKSHQKEFNFKLHVIDKITYKGEDISSSLIRHKIEHGNIEAANGLLGYTYFIKGNVIQGKQLGRTLGFPTANIEITDSLCLKNGVYISVVELDGKFLPGVSSIGRNPTVGDAKRMFETHIFNFDNDIYGEEIKVRLLGFIRAECRFNSIEELRDRVFLDMDLARNYFSEHDIYNMGIL